MPKRILWDLEESVILLDGLTQVLDGKLSRKEAVTNISVQLREKAKLKGIEIDELYRNESGITFQMMIMEYALTGNKHGFQRDITASEPFRKAVDLYINDRSEYEKVLFKAKASMNKQLSDISVSFSNMIETETNHSSESSQNAKNMSDNSMNQTYTTTLSEERDINHQSGSISVQGDLEEACTYAEMYRLNPIDFEGININFEIDNIRFSTRTFNFLSRQGIMTVGDLLRVKESDLRKANGFGKKTQNEVNDFLQKLSDKQADIFTLTPKAPLQRSYGLTDKPESLSLTDNLVCHKGDIFDGNFTFAEDLYLTDAERASVAFMREGHELLEYDLIQLAKVQPEKVRPIQRMLKNTIYTGEERHKLVELVAQIPEYRRHTSVGGYINAFSENQITRDTLQSIYGSDKESLDSILKKLSLSKREIKLALEFVEWCAFDIKEELQHLFNSIHKKENMKIVLRERSKHATLETAGQILGVTRERVRQIELKARHLFSKWYSHTKVLSQISAIRNGDLTLTPAELQEYFGPDTSEIIYLLKTTENLPFFYDSQLDVFIVEELDQSERVRSYVEELPDKFNVSRLDSIWKDASEKGLSTELLMISIKDTYKLTGSTYHRYRLSVQEICRHTLTKYFKNGMYVYDEQQLNEFRKYVDSEFGDVGLPRQNRALSSDIIRVSILCGRGKYKLYDENEVISKSLLDAICSYIDESTKNIFLTNTLFSVFEEELLAEGVDNKYYLQGLMHRQLGDRYVFRRDYVSKDDTYTTIYMEIVNYIKQFDHPISKKQIQDEYPGITEIVLNFSVSDPKIINLFGEYIHADKLDFHKDDIQYFKLVLETMLSENGYCNTRDIYAYIKDDNPISMKRLYILYQYSLFSVLEYLFQEDYQFSRPYIAYPNVEISHASERMDELIRDSDTITLAEINEYAREVHFEIYSILDFVDEHNDTHLLKNDRELISIDASGIDAGCASQIEELILEEITGTMLISNLKSVNKFPRIAIPWTEWLIYSVLRKWAKHLVAETISTASSGHKQFRYMHPIVAIKGQLSVDNIEFIELSDADGIIEKIDDLDHIDDLIADIIAEELGDL